MSQQAGELIHEGTLTFGHSPDPDDAYMFYGFAEDAVHVELPAENGTRRWKVDHLLEDIQSLNERAMKAELEITAISAHTYPYVAENYWVMKTGVSMGDDYGPIVVTKEPCSLEDLRGKKIAIPGKMTTANLVLNIFLPEHEPVNVFFDQIQKAVADGEVDAGVVIHEGQLTFGTDGLHKVADLGVLWKQDTGLPLPLGLDIVRKDLGRDLAEAASTALQNSIYYARERQADAMKYALNWGRDLNMDLGTRFVDMYVNDWTLDLGVEGRKALETLLERGTAIGMVPKVSELVIL